MSTVMSGLQSVKVGEGDYVVVQGAGGLGLAATALARDMGADRVIAVDKLEQRLELAKELGATHTINANEYDTPQARINRGRERTDGRNAGGSPAPAHGARKPYCCCSVCLLVPDVTKSTHALASAAFLESFNAAIGSVATTF